MALFASQLILSLPTLLKISRFRWCLLITPYYSDGFRRAALLLFSSPPPSSTAGLHDDMRRATRCLFSLFILLSSFHTLSSTYPLFFSSIFSVFIVSQHEDFICFFFFLKRAAAIFSLSYAAPPQLFIHMPVSEPRQIGWIFHRQPPLL